MTLPQPSPRVILNALEGSAYIVDARGLVLFAGGSDWDSETEGQRWLSAAAVSGRSLFDMIDGDDLRQAYRAIHDRVLAGSSHLSFEYRCDAPDRRREMRMTLGRLALGGGDVAVLYHSTLVSSISRVPLAFLKNDEALRRYRASAALPIVTICAWCADVALAGGGWFKPEDYYRRGGPADVQLSHGMCPPCRHNMVAMLGGGDPALEQDALRADHTKF